MSSQLGAVYKTRSGSSCEALDLPNFDDVTNISRQGLTDGLSGHYNGVVSLVVKRIVEGGTTQILTGVRTDKNQTHPDVVSVPTEVRAMETIAASLDEDGVSSMPDAKTLIFRGDTKCFTRTRHCYATNIGEVATHMLAIKLNLGDKVEDLVVGGAQFQYHNMHLGCSKVDYDPATDEDVLEAIAMLNIGVTVPEGYSHMFPTETSELSLLTWVNEADFARGLRERRATDFLGEKLEDKDILDVCVHGLCLVTTNLAIQSRRQ